MQLYQRWHWMRWLLLFSVSIFLDNWEHRRRLRKQLISPFLSLFITAAVLALPFATQPTTPNSIMVLSTASWVLVVSAAAPWWCWGRMLRRSVVSRSTMGVGIACSPLLMDVPATPAVLSMSARSTPKMVLSTLLLLERRWLVRYYRRSEGRIYSWNNYFGLTCSLYGELVVIDIESTMFSRR